MSHKPNRRKFLISAGAAGAAGIGLCHVVPARVLGGAEGPPPSEALRYAIIGVGGLGSAIASGCVTAGNKHRRLIAICDCDPNRLEQMRGRFAPLVKENQGHELACYLDFRDLLERTDLDVVHVGTPPQWHALISIMAMQMGIDVMCEKPMVRFINEGPRVIEAAKQYGRICLVDSGCFHDMSRTAAVARKLARAGLLGQPLTGRRLLPHNGGRTRALPKTIAPPEENPARDMWCGPSPWIPWRGGPFRHLWNYDNGMQADIGAHHVPTVVECLNKFGEDPVEIVGEGHYPPDPQFIQPYYRSVLRYADGTKLVLESSLGQEGQPAIGFEIAGPKGRIYAEGQKDTPRSDPPELLAAAAKLPDEPRRISSDEAFRTRKDAYAQNPSAEVQFSAEKTIHLSNIAFRTGRKIIWDPAKQTIVGDDEAASLLNLPVRAPWRLY
ncbi:MAG: Gfo/Idh/MocA family oxidoreductase [Thermoguttaceae bacterium]|jgi:predicted dehydrogenase